MNEQAFWRTIDILLDLAFWGFAVIALLLGIVVGWVIWEDTQWMRESDKEIKERREMTEKERLEEWEREFERLKDKDTL